MDLKYILSSIIFTTFVGYLLDLGGFAQFELITPTIFLIGQGLLMAVILVANTPIAKGGAMVVFAGWLFAFMLSISLPAMPFQELIYAVLFVPSFIAIAFTLMELGRL